MLRYAPFEPRGSQPDPHSPAGAPVAVRPATPADVPGIVAVAATRGERPAGFPERVAGWVADAERCVLVAYSPADGVVGWAMVSRWRHDDVPEGHVISALTVDPRWWRCGVGSRLIGGLLAWTWLRADHLWSIVNVRNEASLALHRRHGFVEVRRGPSFGGVQFDGVPPDRGEGVLLWATRATDRTPEPATKEHSA